MPQEFVGECPNGYSDCRRILNGSHPTPLARVALSANNDATRFDKCVMSLDRDAKTNICVECLGDCDCGLQQYCHLDDGVCFIREDVVVPSHKINSATITESRRLNGVRYAWVCDATSRAKWGTCQKKNIPTSCSNTYAAHTDTDMVKRIHQNFDATWTANGFCGEALYYSETYTDPSRLTSYMGQERASDSATVIAAANTNRRAGVRRVLWAGRCINHVCYECKTEGQEDCNGRICINGRYQHRTGAETGALGAAVYADAAETEAKSKSNSSDQTAIQYTILAITFAIAIISLFILFFHCFCGVKRS